MLKIFLKFFYILIILFCSSCNVFASDEAVSIVLKAFEFSGENPSVISSYSAQFHVITKSNDTKIVAEKDIKIRMVGNNMYAAKTDDYKLKRFFSVSESISELGRSETIMIAMGSVNLDSYVAFESTQSLVKRVRGTRDILPIPEVQRLGRIFFLPGIFVSVTHQKIDKQRYSFPANFAKEINEELNKNNLSCEIVGEVNYDGVATAKIIEIKKGEMCVCKYHIDILRGYLCPYMWDGGDDELYFEYVAKDYFQEKNTSLYYPKNIVCKRLMTTEEYQLLPNTLQLNQPILDNEFSIEIPEKAYIQDWIPRKSFIGLTMDEMNKLVENEPRQRQIIQYRAIKKGVISFADNSYKIENLDWIVKETFEKPPVESSFIKQNGFPLYRVISISLGILMLFIAFLITRYKRHNKIDD
jgi:hypothetical protein